MYFFGFLGFNETKKSNNCHEFFFLNFINKSINGVELAVFFRFSKGHPPNFVFIVFNKISDPFSSIFPVN